MRVTSKGQVTIPQDIREHAGFLPGSEVQFIIGDDGIVRVIRSKDQLRDPEITKALKRLAGSAESKMTTDEIMALTRT